MRAQCGPVETLIDNNNSRANRETEGHRCRRHQGDPKILTLRLFKCRPSRTQRQLESHPFTMVARPRRHEPCIGETFPVLYRSNFEDAIALYGVPTMVFDLHLLVPDLNEATRALMERGWTDARPPNSTYSFLGPISQR